MYALLNLHLVLILTFIERFIILPLFYNLDLYAIKRLTVIYKRSQIEFYIALRSYVMFL